MGLALEHFQALIPAIGLPGTQCTEPALQVGITPSREGGAIDPDLTGEQVEVLTSKKTKGMFTLAFRRAPALT